MEARRIKEIKNIDAFDSFQWLGDDLKKFNLIYGWNGSGKTTISRIFSFLERKSIHIPDLSSVEFTLQTGNGIIKQASLTTNNLNIRVFNEDFVDENLLFEQSQAKKIIILGKENVTVQKEIDALTFQRDEKDKAVLALEEQLDKMPDLSQILSKAGSEVPKVFANTPLASGGYYGRNYDKRKVDKHLESGSVSEENIESLIIPTQAEIDAQRDTIKNDKKKIELSVSDIPDFSALFSGANELLNTAISVTTIDGLKDDRGLRSWVEAGYKLHKERGLNKCQFCDGSVSDELLLKLGSYFTDELEKAKGQIEATISDLEKQESNSSLEIQSDALFPEAAKNYEEAKKELAAHTKVIREGIAGLIYQLKEKKENLHDHEQKQSPINYPVEAVSNANRSIAKIRATISEHNGKIDTIEDEVKKAATTIELHIIAKTLSDKEYFKHKKETEKTREDIRKLVSERGALESEINTKKASLHNASDAVDKINSILKEFFGTDFIYLEVHETPEKEIQYVLKRRGKDAKHLSEGEASVLTLIYFLIKLEEDGCDKSNSLIVIDDPVDSQDSVFLFQTTGLLKRQLKGAGQVLILTHNFEFFNLIRDWYLDRQTKDRSALFLISHNRAGIPHEVKVDNLPELLREYKTEYQYLFCRLYQYANDIEPKLDEPLVPNIARKVLEYFAGFKWACKTTEDFTNIVNNRFVADQNQLRKGTGDFVVKFLHEYSHGQDFSRAITATMLESKQIAKNVLEFIRLADSEHYADMAALCKPKGNLTYVVTPTLGE